MFTFLIATILLFFPVSESPAQDHTPVLALSAGMVSEAGELMLEECWLYHPGDDEAWADPEFDDRKWERNETTLRPGGIQESEWQGVGWFRLHVLVDSTLAGDPFLMMIYRAGTADVYLDGKPVSTVERSGRAPDIEPSVLSFTGGSRHVLAVRFTNESYKKYEEAGISAGFVLWLRTPQSLALTLSRGNEEDLTIQAFLTSVALTFALLHFILYWFSPDLKSNLIFSLFALLFAGNIFFDYQINLSLAPPERLTALRIHRAIMPLPPMAALLFVYSVFGSRLSWRFWVITAGLVISGYFAVQKPIDNLGYASLFGLIAAVEAVTKITSGIRSNTEGAWIIATGFALLFLFSSYDGVMDVGLIEPVWGIQNGYTFGFIGLLVCMSVYLSREFARRKERILEHERRAREQEIESRILAADNARKTRELEEARDLQLSMLPKEVPDLPHLEIAVYMKPATEVGGDYYDFHNEPDGTLTIAIGDATGHGARAGTMVTVTKSLFRELAGGDDLRQIFEKYTEAIKLLNLNQLYMALALVRIKDHSMTISSAGMPPAFLFHASSGQISEITLKGMPLGCFAGFPYQTVHQDFSKGDTLVLMSDGLPEMFNPASEVMGYTRVKEVIRANGSGQPQELIDEMKRAGEQWAAGRPQSDDVTFVVVRVRA